MIAGISLLSGSFIAVVQDFLDFYAGVFVLLGLTATVVLGLIATDRIILTVRARVAMQALHRAFAVFSVGFLITHVATKIIKREAVPAEAFLPFIGDFEVAFGAIAGQLMLLIAVTGAFRARFVGIRWPWLWRAIHVAAYLAWPISIFHGLVAGRAGAEWVNLSYIGALLGVGIALVIRLTVGVRPKDGAPGNVRAVNVGTKAERIRVDDVFDEEFWSTLRKEVRR